MIGDLDEASGTPAVEQVIRYFDGEMPPEEAEAFERQAAQDEEFAGRARSIWEILETLSSIRGEIDPEVLKKVVQEERALWWRERLPHAFAELASKGYRLKEGVDAALEVTFDAVAQASDRLIRPLVACARLTAGFEFQYAHAGLKGQMKTKGLPHDAPRGTGYFVTQALPQGAKITADATKREVRVEFLDHVPMCVILIPEDAGLATLEPKETAPREFLFEPVEPGRYLLVVVAEGA